MDQETKNKIIELREKGGAIWSELRMLESVQWEDENKHLEGKYLKLKTSYGRDEEDEIEEWDMYFKVLKVDVKRKRIVVEEIQETVRSEISFHITECHSYIGDYEQITEEDYEKARDALIEKLKTGPSAYNTGKTW